jgi:hypothetical protein
MIIHNVVPNVRVDRTGRRRYVTITHVPLHDSAVAASCQIVSSYVLLRSQLSDVRCVILYVTGHCSNMIITAT